jgi:hypothetical protein
MLSACAGWLSRCSLLGHAVGEWTAMGQQMLALPSMTAVPARPVPIHRRLACGTSARLNLALWSQEPVCARAHQATLPRHAEAPLSAPVWTRFGPAVATPTQDGHRSSRPSVTSKEDARGSRRHPRPARRHPPHARLRGPLGRVRAPPLGTAPPPRVAHPPPRGAATARRAIAPPPRAAAPPRATARLPPLGSPVSSSGCPASSSRSRGSSSEALPRNARMPRKSAGCLRRSVARSGAIQ